MESPGSLPPDPAIQITGLTKYFGQKLAVAGIDLVVPSGSFYGLLGPNGAGKSTTLAMVTGLLRPDAGSIDVTGINAIRNPLALKQHIGVVPETLLLFERLTGAELLEYVGLIRGLARNVTSERAAELLAVFDLDTEASKLIVDYSQGMRKKISLAAALIHAPKVLLLDEPFESVDPVSVRTIKRVLHELVSSGSTVVFSSHVMETVEDLCDHVSIMNHGRLMAAGPIDQISQGQRLEQVFAQIVGAETPDTDRLTWLHTKQ